MTEPPGLSQRLKAIAAFLEVFESPGFSFGIWEGGERTASGAIQMPYFELSPGALDFIRTCSANGWLQTDFD